MAPIPIFENGVGYALKTYDQLAASPVEAMAQMAMADLLAKGFTPYNHLAWNDRVIALTTMLNEPVSCIVWRENEAAQTAFLALGATLPSHQRQGLYSLLFREFAIYLRGMHPRLRAIESGYHVDNEASAAMSRATGRTVTHHVTHYSLREG